MIKTILEILIIFASILNMIAAHKDNKTHFTSKRWNIVILVTSVILTCSWFTKGIVFKSGPEVLSYVVGTVYGIIAGYHFYYIRYLDSIEVKIPNDDGYIDIGRWKEDDSTSTTNFIDMK